MISTLHLLKNVKVNSTTVTKTTVVGHFNGSHFEHTSELAYMNTNDDNNYN